MKHEVNVIIDNGLWNEKDIQLFFQGQDVDILPESTTMFDILIQYGFFKSRSDVRKNWNKTDMEVPDGFTDLENIGKLNRRITILKIIDGI